ncbi:putative YigZ family protein [Homoserinimonas aerilata]|uniref:Putative YigZ family protein n=1 Tax=Homoserinimonas aerilata TaxID=1162970 RepID=A0A542YKH8_9MICO|nr:YigZ family protein [Homoserinimonas aerilata]TQL48572.1 putative YigZ family protein [Homoserinimonas aerilata]
MAESTIRGGAGARVDTEIEVKRSRFLCRLVRVETEEAARAAVELARREHWDARHHCSAFILGASVLPGQIRRSSDDGEPSGTAGAPMLDALAGRGLIDCVAVVTRYFGGVLLGAGGLVRAYSDAVLTAVDEAHATNRLVERARRELFALPLSHADAGRVEAELRQRGVGVLGTEYGSRAVVRLTGDGEEVAAIVAAATAGAGRLEPLGTEWVDVEPTGRA